MIYFFDNCISYKLSDMLRALDVDTESLREKHPTNIKDLVLFSQLQKRRDVVFVSVDRSQLTREAEARALKEADMTALYFGPFFQKMKFWDQAIWLVKRWPRISGYAEGVVMGTCAGIKQNGRAEVYRL